MKEGTKLDFETEDCLLQRHEKNPIWNELFELEFTDLEEGKVVIVLFDEAAPQEFQVLGYCQFYLQVWITMSPFQPTWTYSSFL